MQISTDDARGIARRFRSISDTFATFQFTNWNTLSAVNSYKIEKIESSLLKYSLSLINQIIGVTMEEIDVDEFAFYQLMDELEGYIDERSEIDSLCDEDSSIDEMIDEFINAGSICVRIGDAFMTKNSSVIEFAVSDIYSII